MIDHTTSRLVIAPGKGKKGRSFEAHLLVYLTADPLWDSGSPPKDVRRPAFLACCGSEQELRAFLANLRSGRQAVVTGGDDEKIEFPRRSGHRFHLRPAPGGAAVATAWLPALFDLDQAAALDHARFVFAPARWWTDEQAAKLGAPFDRAPEDERRELVTASLFAAHLDHRTTIPILADPAFHRHLLRAAREQPWFHAPKRHSWNGGALWVRQPLATRFFEEIAAVHVGRQDLEGFVRDQIREWRKTHGPTRVPSRRRLLSDPGAPADQLELFAHVA